MILIKEIVSVWTWLDCVPLTDVIALIGPFVSFTPSADVQREYFVSFVFALLRLCLSSTLTVRLGKNRTWRVGAKTQGFTITTDESSTVYNHSLCNNSEWDCVFTLYWYVMSDTDLYHSVDISLCTILNTPGLCMLITITISQQLLTLLLYKMYLPLIFLQWALCVSGYDSTFSNKGLTSHIVGWR